MIFLLTIDIKNILIEFVKQHDSSCPCCCSCHNVSDQNFYHDEENSNKYIERHFKIPFKNAKKISVKADIRF